MADFTRKVKFLKCQISIYSSILWESNAIWGLIDPTKYIRITYGSFKHFFKLVIINFFDNLSNILGEYVAFLWGIVRLTTTLCFRFVETKCTVISQHNKI